VIVGYLTVADWNGRWARPPQTEKLLDGECAVHHVGGGAWMGGLVPRGTNHSREAACRVFFNLNEYAINTKGYSFLDYDVLVWYDRYNDICWIGDGRGEYMSAATLDRNELCEAVVLCGNTHLREPLEPELEGLAHAIVHGIRKGWLSKDAVIYPHRDNPAHPNATTCCGQFLIPKLPGVARRVDELLGTPPPAPPTGGHVLLYKVVSGDSYYAICRKVYADGAATPARVAAIQAANTDNPTLNPGDLINIPGRLP
jgi:hypothetical protein